MIEQPFNDADMFPLLRDLFIELAERIRDHGPESAEVHSFIATHRHTHPDFPEIARISMLHAEKFAENATLNNKERDFIQDFYIVVHTYGPDAWETEHFISEIPEELAYIIDLMNITRSILRDLIRCGEYQGCQEDEKQEEEDSADWWKQA